MRHEGRGTRRELAAGTYIFELPSNMSHGLVRVSSRDRRQVYLTAFTHEIDRHESRPHCFRLSASTRD